MEKNQTIGHLYTLAVVGTPEEARTRTIGEIKRLQGGMIVSAIVSILTMLAEIKTQLLVVAESTAKVDNLVDTLGSLVFGVLLIVFVVRLMRQHFEYSLLVGYLYSLPRESVNT